MTSSYEIDIIIADDHELIREGFHVMFAKTSGIKIIGEATNGEELVKLTRRLRPQVVVTDIKMPKMDGVEATKQIKNEFPEIGIVALTMFGDEDLIYDMCDAGAKAYVLKDAHKNEILAAIKSVHRDESYYCRTIQKKVDKLKSAKNNRLEMPQRIQFAPREKEIITMICEEYTNIKIASKTGLSKRTIEDYRTKILIKTNSKNTAGLVKYAIKYKLFKND